MNLRSFENVKRSTASMRSKGSSESLMLRTCVGKYAETLVNDAENNSRSEEVWSVKIVPVLEVGNRLQQRRWQRESPAERGSSFSHDHDGVSAGACL